MADAQVASPIAHWAPRFTAQGVDPSDCVNLTYRWRPQAADWLADRLAAL